MSDVAPQVVMPRSTGLVVYYVNVGIIAPAQVEETLNKRKMELLAQDGVRDAIERGGYTLTMIAVRGEETRMETLPLP